MDFMINVISRNVVVVRAADDKPGTLRLTSCSFINHQFIYGFYTNCSNVAQNPAN